MRIALVSPYSWTYPGGVTRHIEALAERFIEDGHDVRVLAPLDPPDTFAAVAAPWRAPADARGPRLPGLAGSHGRLQGQRRGLEPVDQPHGVATLHQELRTGGYDVVHIHEPVAPLAGWVATD